MSDGTRPDLPAALSAVAIRAYVNATGWTEGPQGSCGSVFERDGFKASVPHEDDDPDAIRMSLYRLASAEGRTPEATAAAIAEYRDARGPEVTAGVPAVTSPAPAPAGRSGTATGPSSPGAGDLPAPARRAAEAAYRGWRIGDDGEGRLHAALIAAAPLIRADAEAQLAEVRQTIAAFFTHHGNSAVFALRSARDLAEGIRQVLDRAPLEPLSAVCTGPDCGEQFADSETSEYLFATRDRMERLLYADGWASDPVLCPACQEEAAGQPKLPGVAR